MSGIPINVFTWKANKTDLVLANKIIDAIKGYTKVELEIHMDDLSTVSAAPDLECACIAFGLMAHGQYKTTGPDWAFPDLKLLRPIEENTETRKEAFKLIKSIGEQLDDIALSYQEPIESHIEMPSGITVGKTNTDIQISEKEAEYLRQLKDLLGGSKIVITKGDIKIEVE